MAKKKTNRNSVAQPSPSQPAHNATPVSPSTPSASLGLSKGNTEMAMFDDMLGTDLEAIKEFPAEHRKVFAILKSMYGGEVRLDASRRTVWNKRLLGFEVALQAFDNASIFTRLDIELPPEYPKIGPTAHLVELEPNTEALKATIKDVIDLHVKTEMGDEFMVSNILQDIEQKLNDESAEQERKAKGISLEEERATTEVAAQADATSRQELALRQKEAEAAAKEAQLAQDVENHIRRRQLLASSHSGQEDQIAAEEYPADCVIFGHDIIYHNSSLDADLSFRAVRSTAVISKRPNKTVTIACPYRNNDLKPIQLVLKEVRLPDRVDGKEDSRNTLQEIEMALQEVKTFEHAAIVKIYDYKLEQVHEAGSPEHWELTVLTEFAQGGPLTTLLNLCGQLNAARLRTYCRSILDALEFLDRKGYVHPAIHAHNILFFGSEHSKYQAKLSDGYGTTLRELVEQSQHSSGLPEINTGNWAAPELIGGRSARNNKTCIWELGVVLLQMAMGNDLTERYTSPEDALMRADFDMDFDHLISKMCSISARKRPTAFHLQSHQFFKSHEPSLFRSQARGTAAVASLSRSRSLAESRWASEWEPIGQLGKGGFGVVVKARNRLDGHFYAVKQLKCRSLADLDEIWSEVRMLAQLNHPSIVRYFGAWSEDDLQDMTDTDTSTAMTDQRSFAPPTGSAAPPSNLFGMPSTGHDFMDPSLAQTHDAEVEEDDEEEEEEDDDDGNMFGYQSAPSDGEVEDSQAIESDDDNDSEPSDPFALQHYIDNKIKEEPNFFESNSEQNVESEDRIPSRPEPFQPAKGFPSVIRRPQQYYSKKSTLYIQMELCETGTLFDLIRSGLPGMIEESWRIFRLLLDGLHHIHSMGVVHRDLKPMNIFIDAQKMPKIGDFGLASPSQASVDGHKLATHVAGPMSRGIGTLFYIPPELEESKATGRYSSKADMFALGIIFFEMCFPFKTATERIKWLQSINNDPCKLPGRFDEEEFKVQGRIIKSLLSHTPSERPSANDLLLDPEIPEPLEEEKEQRFVERLVHGDPEQFQRVMQNFMSKTATRSQLLAYSAIDQDDFEQPDQYLVNFIQQKLAEVFKAHGGVEEARETVFPVEGLYPNAVRFLGDAGFALQLPHDLTVPFARSVAVRKPKYAKCFCFGSVFRQRGPGVEPLCIPEVDFDIASFSAKDLSLKDAQVISVLDDCLTKLGSLFRRSFSIVISHGDLLDLVLRACQVPEARFETVKRILSILNVGKTTWKQVQLELQSSHVGLTSTTIAAISQFNFSSDFEEMRQRVLAMLKQLNKDDSAIKATRTLNRLQEVDDYLRRLRVRTPTLFSPLSNTSEALYRGSLMFKCVESKTQKTVVVGGRYDGLIRNYRTATQRTGARAAGFRINIMDLASYARNDAQPAGIKSGKSKIVIPPSISPRIDVVVTSFDEATLQTHCVEIIRNVLDAGISAELSEHFTTMDELDQAYATTTKYWLVIVRPIGTAQRAIKVRSPSRDETDIPPSELVEYLKDEITERTGTVTSEPVLKRTRSSHGAAERENVVILTPQHKSKKVNRAAIVDSARTAAREMAESMTTNCKVLAIDTDDETLHRIRNTRLTDGDTWRALRQSVALVEREYIQEIQEQLLDWSKDKQNGAFLCNYKTKSCIYYDLGKV
ncbi:eukaryotic translation initiation factor 2-alpha kinase [Neophaeococcomyces mojaviensis]|uniref:Eukaryotic translation initiation factor 2-alpha kinase n=1 Tax=Neophaeococcomyces mojaviensis TaxID=3383035 RepID=A0ACC3A8Z4_9EURO|nr:eukaryotic translation initiation factor 2-alpha kinase [Knufia sp. JES_112]